MFSLSTTTRINFEFVSPLLAVVSITVVSITVAIVRMKEEENVKNSYSNDAIMQVPS